MSRLIRMDASGHTTLAEWTAGDDSRPSSWTCQEILPNDGRRGTNGNSCKRSRRKRAATRIFVGWSI